MVSVPLCPRLPSPAPPGEVSGPFLRRLPKETTRQSCWLGAVGKQPGMCSPCRERWSGKGVAAPLTGRPGRIIPRVSCLPRRGCGALVSEQIAVAPPASGASGRVPALSAASAADPTSKSDGGQERSRGSVARLLTDKHNRLQPPARTYGGRLTSRASSAVFSRPRAHRKARSAFKGRARGLPLDESSVPWAAKL